MGTTKLKLWNDALAELGQAYLSATDNAGVAPAALAEVHDRTVLHCLEQGYWNFCQKTSTLATEGGTSVQFGYTYPFPKPAGWLRTIRISTNNTYWPPFEDYEDTGTQIHANVTPLYMAFINSELATEGSPTYARWPESFSYYVSCELAKRICRRIGGAADEHERITKTADDAKNDALSKDATNEGVRWPPEGRWTLSRRGNSRGDRGNRGSLTG